jgi:hypothetical protein
MPAGKRCYAPAAQGSKCVSALLKRRSASKEAVSGSNPGSTPAQGWVIGGQYRSRGFLYFQAMSLHTTAISTQFSNYIVYVDESGDHGVERIDPDYPVLVLAFCVFHKRHYAHTVVAEIESLKFRHFGHDIVVLHEHDIRKEKGSFLFGDRQGKERFLDELTGVIDAGNFILISCVIHKGMLREQNLLKDNPYHLALGFCLETLFELLLEKGQTESSTHIVFECRGKREDLDLEREFVRICSCRCFGLIVLIARSTF